VHGANPVVVTMLAVAKLDVVEGTPVLDGAGHLVGICTIGADGVAVMAVSTMPGPAATSSTAAASSSTTAPTTKPTSGSVTTLTVASTQPTATPVPVPAASTTVPATPGPLPNGTTTTSLPTSTTLSGGVAATTAPR